MLNNYEFNLVIIKAQNVGLSVDKSRLCNLPARPCLTGRQAMSIPTFGEYCQMGPELTIIINVTEH